MKARVWCVYGVDVTALRVMPLGYRWGSCSTDGKVNIHWATMQLPPDLIDYVLVHELAHTRHPDHGAGFWGTVERAMPDSPARRMRLRLAGPGLWLPGLRLIEGSGDGAGETRVRSGYFSLSPPP